MKDTRDDEFIRALLVCPDEYPGLCAESVLRSQGYTVWEADGFRKALVLANQDPPHVLFCPAVSPRSSGVNLVLELQKRIRTRGVRVIVVCSPETRKESLSTGSVSVRSNASPEELIQVLWRALQATDKDRGSRRETRTRTRVRSISG